MGLFFSRLINFFCLVIALLLSGNGKAVNFGPPLAVLGIGASKSL